MDVGLGDDDKNIREDFDEWKVKVCTRLSARMPAYISVCTPTDKPVSRQNMCFMSVGV